MQSVDFSSLNKNGGNGAFSFVPTPRGPERPTLYDAGEDWVTMQWSNMGNGNIYEIQWRVAGDEHWTTASSSLTGTIVKKKRLSSENSYEFRVRTKDSVGGWGPFSPPSDLVSPLAGEEAAKRMAAPEPFDLQYDSITIRWVEVKEARGYGVEYRSNGAPRWESASDKEIVTSTVMRKKQLVSGVAYEFRVRPRIGSKWEAWSAPSQPITTLLVAPFFRNILGNVLVDADATQHRIDSIAGKTVAFYFANERAQSCKVVTPQLVQFYFQLKAAGKEFCIVLISLDADEGAFEVHMEGKPFLAVPFSESELREKVTTACGINERVLPKMLVFAETGKLLDKNATAQPLTLTTFEKWRAICDQASA